MDSRVAALAARQFGAITRMQLLGLGMSSSAIDRQVASGVLRTLYAGVYAIAGSPRSREQAFMAALLAAGTPGALAALSAAELWRFEGVRAKRPDVLVPEDRRVVVSGITVRRSRTLQKRDIVLLGVFRVTSVERTLIDLAGILSADALEDVLDEALRRKLTTAAKVLERIRALGRGVPGIATLRRLVLERLGVRPRGSRLESKFFRRLARAGVPAPVSQYELRDEQGRFVGFIDFAYPEHRLAIEIDGSGHLSRKVRERDLVRQNQIIQVGWRILRYSETRVESDPGVPIEIRDALMSRSADEVPRKPGKIIRRTASNGAKRSPSSRSRS